MALVLTLALAVTSPAFAQADEPGDTDPDVPLHIEDLLCPRALEGCITQGFHTHHRVFVVDIEGEYRALCDDVGGVCLEFSRTAENHLNTLDLNPLANDPFGAGMSTLMGFLTVVLRQSHRHACHESTLAVEPRHEYSRWHSRWQDRLEPPSRPGGAERHRAPLLRRGDATGRYPA